MLKGVNQEEKLTGNFHFLLSTFEYFQIMHVAFAIRKRDTNYKKKRKEQYRVRSLPS